ncbi:FEN1 [Cordylochernes scorpioides]|uniref:Flap endonuclease 1 n=1 Tax=Cordylochernes scorpioides TaxID=51811 RepID=A0ABY6KKP8_9ARAC|nr:FEN1 [Cordylochernes scorpioides]
MPLGKPRASLRSSHETQQLHLKPFDYGSRVGTNHGVVGRKVAIDASMSIYQFLIAVRQEANVLTNAEGETTSLDLCSHLVGLFYRTIRMLENGLKPVYVFDGKPPQMKKGELEKRAERREEAQKQLAEAEEKGVAEDVNKFSRRLVKVTPQHNNDCKKLLKYMGVPYIEAPCEAEAQCAALVKAGKVYGTATEDMDGLTFGSNVLLRHMTFSEARKMPIKEFTLATILSELKLTQDQAVCKEKDCGFQFIDLCILLGCDYCDSIKGVGPKRAIELITKYGSLDNIVENIDTKVCSLILGTRGTAHDNHMCLWCSEDRVRNGVKKLNKSRQSSTQGRLDSFFTVTPSQNGGVKRKVSGFSL